MTHHENQNWSIAHKFLLRFVFLYLIFYIVPYGFEYIQEIKMNEISIWENITMSFGEWVFGWEFNEDRLLKGFDSKYDYSRFSLIALMSLLGSILWTFIESKNKPHIDTDLKILTKTILRYHVGLTMILYGLSKAFMLQFGEMNLDILETKVGETNGMGFLWTFMSYSKFYTMTAGWIEVIGGVLLLFRKTTFVGTFIVLASMVNVVLIDIGYDVRVKMFAIHLLLMSILLLMEDIKRIINFFILNKATQPSIDQALFTSKKGKKIGLILKGILLTYISISFFITFKSRINTQQNNMYPTLTTFHDVDTHIVNGDTLAKTDDSRWKTMSINGSSYRPETMKLTKMYGYNDVYKFTADTLQKTIKFFSSNSPETYEFQYDKLENKDFIFEGYSSQGDTIWIRTRSKSLEDYPLTANKIRWITDRN